MADRAAVIRSANSYAFRQTAASSGRIAPGSVFRHKSCIQVKAHRSRKVMPASAGGVGGGFGVVVALIAHGNVAGQFGSYVLGLVVVSGLLSATPYSLKMRAQAAIRSP